MFKNNIKSSELKLYYKLINEEAYAQREIALDMIRHTGLYALNVIHINSLIKRFNNRLSEVNEIVNYTIEKLKYEPFYDTIDAVNDIILQSEKIIQLLENLKKEKISS